MGKAARRKGKEQRVRGGDAYVDTFLGMCGTGASGVNPDAVISNLSVAARCVSLRSELLASVPLCLYRRTKDGGRERADDHPLFQILDCMPNPNMTAFEFREFLIRSLDLMGNGYARIERNARGQVTALYPFPPGMVAIERLASGRLRYRATDYNGVVWVLLQEEMLHVRGPTKNGMYGLSPIQIAHGALHLAMAHAETAEALTENKLQPGGLLMYPNQLNPTAKEDLRKGISGRFAGAGNAGRVMILDGGAKFEQLSFSPNDAQFLESRKLGNEDVARIFGLPPTTVGITDKATYSNSEHEGQALVQNALGPLAARIEGALARCLLSDAGRRSYYIEHDLNGLLRGDIEARFKAYRIAREIGAFSPNDVRRRENEPPLAEGDQYHMPANWIPLGQVRLTQGGSILPDDGTQTTGAGA
ncbi:phage portal protein [Rhodoblastus acidophilus]|uniref:Phage portal protein n=1 Tax=Rhodoblastus acidophilus TaxID=1074 RepID=A0A6N8DK31_RHOAC|nr:phage portal protein [Rhodoblastus acidophilus]MCW2273314.1 HK97 family phage portal protein [Rhodoblastus acidophilus]MTV30206.1 phage portal protein [Rhodoblastus acidophilus]